MLCVFSPKKRSCNHLLVCVSGVSAAERDTIKRKTVKERESVILYTGVIRNLNDSVRWYYKEILIAEISDEPRKNCTDDQCDERFRDRLMLDHQTGSLIITHTRTEDSGEYQLQINNSRFSIIRSFRVSVTGESNLIIQCIFPQAILKYSILCLNPNSKCFHCGRFIK